MVRDTGVVPDVATVLHADLDAFYASVEQLLDPTLRGIPMAVGAGVVVAASYEARAFGVRGAMPTRTARKLCPHLKVVDGSFHRYLEFSERVMEVMTRYTPEIEQVSVDEAFLETKGSMHLFGEPEEIARRIRHDVRSEIGLPISVGVASTKFLAKVASQVAKPDGLVTVPFGGELAFLHPLVIELLWGVGPATSTKLRQAGIETVGDLAATPFDALAGWLGKASAHHLHALAHNDDPRPVKPRPRAKSVGSQQALGRGITESDDIDRTVLGIADRIGRRLRAKERAGRTITVRVRIQGGEVRSRSRTLDAATGVTDAINAVARSLVDEAIEDPEERITLIGVAVSKLVIGAAVQMELGFDAGEVERIGSGAADTGASVDRQIDEIRKKFGNSSVTRAGLLGHTDDNAPDDFRKLVERD